MSELRATAYSARGRHARRAAHGREQLRGVALRLAIVAAILGCWEFIVDTGTVSPLVVASPSQIVGALGADTGTFASALGVTAVEVAIAAAGAIVVGITVGAIVASSSLLYDALIPILNASIAVPWIIMYPLFMVALGLGTASKIGFGFVLAVGPVAGAAAAAFRSIDSRYLLVARAWSATRWQLLTRILIPAALPGIAGGVRLGVGLGIIGVIVGQLLGSDSGLGYLIGYYRTLLATSQVYAGVVLAVLLAYAGSVTLRLFDPRRVDGDREP